MGFEGEIGEAGGQVRPPEIAEGKGERGKRREILRRGRRKSEEVSEGEILRKLASSEEEGMKTALWRISERLRERQEAKEDWKTRERRSLKRVSIGEKEKEKERKRGGRRRRKGRNGNGREK